jgi:hypothetical protein
MRLLDITEAVYFCTPLAAFQPGTSQSLSQFHKGLPARTVRLSERTTPFDIHRISLLNAVERWILFGVADYRRALDMLIPSNAPWAHVTLYYSSFFGANAILGMFGGWIDHERLVDVEQGVPTAQILKITKHPKSPNGYTGSHRVFWDYFYEGCNAIAPWVPTELQTAIAPVNGDRRWLTNTRNDVNYDMHGAYNGARFFDTNFNPRKLSSISGLLRQQLEVTEKMLQLALYFAKELKVKSFAFEGLGDGSRAKVFRDLVSKPTPGLVNQSISRELILH